MAVADAPAGLMDIASTLSPDDIPFKLRCAMCSKLAVNAFRLPCCDQSICESCHGSLPETCPVCTHSPLTPDLCKPHKALRTTLKAFLRTAEKKRKDQLAAAPPASIPTPVEDAQTPIEAPVDTQAAVSVVPTLSEVQPTPPTSEVTKSDEIIPALESAEDNVEVGLTSEPVEAPDQATPPATEPENASIESSEKPEEIMPPNEPTQHSMSEQEQPSEMTNMGPGGWNAMGWNGNFNGMNPYMGNPFNFQNQMGMPTITNQGMFGGMNMAAGMGMNNMGNFNGQGMYGSVGWDDSHQSMWPGAQDNFNPNAFANGSGPPYGGAFGGSNMSYHSNHGYQSGNYGNEYGRGGYRGRGRGYYNGRGGYGGHGPYSHSPEGAYSNTQVPSTDLSTPADTEVPVPENSVEAAPAKSGSEDANEQLQVIPTIDSLDNNYVGQGPYNGYMAQGYGRGGYGGMGVYRNGQMPQSHVNPGVEGAPAAPRAMRQGLPNTSVLRQRAFQNQMQASGNGPGPVPVQLANTSSGTPPDSTGARSPSKAPSMPIRAESPPHSPSQDKTPRPQSPSPQDNAQTKNDIRDGRDKEVPGADGRSRSRSASQVSSRRKHYRESDKNRRKDRDHHNDRRENRPDRYQPSRSKSPSRASESRQVDRLIPVDSRRNSHKRVSPEATERDSARGGRSRRSSRDRSVRREEDRERTRPRESEKYARDRRDRERTSERDRRKDRDRDHGRDRRDRDRGRRDDKDRKRSRRDRSESPNARDRSRVRRVKRSDSTDRKGPKPAVTAPAPEKDPITLEREARNNERMAREKQRRQQKSNQGRHY